MEKPYFYHKFKVEMPIKAGFYEDFVSFMKTFCIQRDLKIEWIQIVEGDGCVSVTFILRGDYMLPSMLVSLGYLWRLRLQFLSNK